MSTIKDLILDIFGVYSAPYYTDGGGIDIIPAGMAGVDWPWISGVVFFGITLYCVFRIIGGAFKK